MAVYQGAASQAAEKVRLECFVSGHELLISADKLFTCHHEPASAGGTKPCSDFFRSLFSRAAKR